jgi:hypothetical protein
VRNARQGGREQSLIPDLTDEELAAVIEALRQVIDDDGYRHSPRLLPFKAALAKLDPTGVPPSSRQPVIMPTPAAKPTHGKRGLKNR